MSDKIPEDLLYTKTHEWIKHDKDTNQYIVGITDYAQASLGDIVFVDDEKDVGDIVKANETVFSVESTKAASEIYSPIDGEIVSVNQILKDEPAIVNTSPYDEGWLFKISGGDKVEEQIKQLLNYNDYQKLNHE